MGSFNESPASSLDCQNALCNTKTHWDGQDRRSQEAHARASDGGCLWNETPRSASRAALARARAARRGQLPAVSRAQLSRRCAHERACHAKHTYKSQAVANRFHRALQISHVNGFRSSQTWDSPLTTSFVLGVVIGPGVARNVSGVSLCAFYVLFAIFMTAVTSTDAHNGGISPRWMAVRRSRGKIMSHHCQPPPAASAKMPNEITIVVYASSTASRHASIQRLYASLSSCVAVFSFNRLPMSAPPAQVRGKHGFQAVFDQVLQPSFDQVLQLL